MSRFGTIVIDPPWEFGDRLGGTVARGAASHYTTLGERHLLELPIGDLAAPISVCVTWVTASHMELGFRCLRSWGFAHKQIWTWIKTGKAEKRLRASDVPLDLSLAFGMGRLARGCSEFMLVGTRGSVSPYVENKSVRGVFLWPALDHSRKPEIVQDALDSMFPDFRKLEVFARRQRPGWTCVGNEAPATLGEDIHDSLSNLVRAA